MRPLRTVIVSLIALAAATLAGPLVFLGSAGAQTSGLCPADQSQNYYPCIENSATDLDCADIGMSVRVVGEDVYNLDGDGDGIACEVQYGPPAALPTPTVAVDPTAVPETPEPTPTLSGLMPTVDGQCLTLDFETSDLAPVTIVTPNGNVTSLTTEAGEWVVGSDNNVRFTPVVNAKYPAGVNLNGMTNGQAVNVTAIAECLTGKLAQTGTTPPTPAATPVVDPTAPPTAATPAPTTPPTDPMPTVTPPGLAYTGSNTTPLAIAGVMLLLAGGAAIAASDRIRR